MDAQKLARSSTAVGTAGEMGQLFTVYEKNWTCVKCKQENYASRGKCSRCKAGKPRSTAADFIQDPALAAAAAGGGARTTWQEVVDPTTYQIYYHNSATNETQWERPAEMGAAPMATGWFGRGQAGGVAAQLFAEENERYLGRPARQQKEFIDKSNYHTEGADEYNIWFGRYNGARDFTKNREAATDRCVLATDAGRTKGDKVVGRTRGRTSFCLQFARGMCMKGDECDNFHRVPTPEDDAGTDELYDVFGRQRFKTHRDDMDGVGSFANPCRTLYVAGLLRERYKTNKDFEEACWRHFGEWGELENCNVIHRISTAFPRYRLRTSAEFAKEAMARQQLDQGEVLNVKWAHDDPNPVAREAIERANRDAVFSILQARGISMESAQFNYPSNYAMPDQKRAKLENGTDVTAAAPALAYPDTSTQYKAQAAQAQYQAQQQMQMQQLQQQEMQQPKPSSAQQRPPPPLSEQPHFAPPPPQPVAAGLKGGAVALPSLDGDWSDWRDAVDTRSGATYLYNVKTRESTWGSEEHRDAQ